MLHKSVEIFSHCSDSPHFRFNLGADPLFDMSQTECHNGEETLDVSLQLLKIMSHIAAGSNKFQPWNAS